MHSQTEISHHLRTSALVKLVPKNSQLHLFSFSFFLVSTLVLTQALGPGFSNVFLITISMNFKINDLFFEKYVINSNIPVGSNCFPLRHLPVVFRKICFLKRG